MAGKRKMPSDSILEGWVGDGLDHVQIQQRIRDDFNEEVALSTVSGHLSRIGLTNRVKYDDFVPWPRIGVDHNHAYQLSMLRIAARLDRGLPVRDVDRGRFERWAADLKQRGLVVTYSYESPDGFYYVAAREGIDDGLIRKPDALIKEPH